MSNFKEKIIDIGRTVIGQGRGVEFKREVEEYATTNGCSEEEARDRFLLKRVEGVTDDIDRKKAFSEDSAEDLSAALKEIFSTAEIDTFDRYANNKVFLGSLSGMPADGTELNKMEANFKSLFDNQAPKSMIIRDCADQTKVLHEILERFGTNPDVASGSDIRDLVLREPELAACIGKFFQTKEAVDRHRGAFDSELKFQESWDTMRKNGRESLNAITSSAKKDLIRGVVVESTRLFKTGNHARAAMNLTSSFAKFASTGVAKGLVGAKDLVGVGYRYVNKNR